MLLTSLPTTPKLSYLCNVKYLLSQGRFFSRCSTPKFAGPPWKVLFFGNDNFALRSLQPLCAKLRTGTLMSSLGVVCKRGTVVYKFACSEGLPVINWPLNLSEIVKLYDIGMVVSFGALIPKAVIDSLPLGCINVHASILPQWRGAAPVAHSVINGDTETGVTIMKIHPYKFDVGEIVRQYRIPILPNETTPGVEKKLSIVGSQLLMECLRDLPRCLELATKQPEEEVSYAPKISPQMSFVNWGKMSDKQVFDLHRGLGHIYPLVTKWMDKRVKLLDISLRTDYQELTDVGHEPVADPQKSALDFLNVGSKKDTPKKVTSEVLPTKNSNNGILEYDKTKKLLKVICANGRSVIVNKLLISKKAISGSDFYNGFLSRASKEYWKFDLWTSS